MAQHRMIDAAWKAYKDEIYYDYKIDDVLTINDCKEDFFAGALSLFRLLLDSNAITDENMIAPLKVEFEEFTNATFGT